MVIIYSLITNPFSNIHKGTHQAVQADFQFSIFFILSSFQFCVIACREIILPTLFLELLNLLKTENIIFLLGIGVILFEFYKIILILKGSFKK